MREKDACQDGNFQLSARHEIVLERYSDHQYESDKTLTASAGGLVDMVVSKVPEVLNMTGNMQGRNRPDSLLKLHVGIGRNRVLSRYLIKMRPWKEMQFGSRAGERLRWSKTREKMR